MSRKFNKSEWVPPEYRDLNRFKGMNLTEVIENLEVSEVRPEQEELKPEKEPVSIFYGFLDLLRGKGIRVSVPEWLQFLTVLEQKTTIDELKELVDSNELLDKIRLFSKITLIKDKADEASFHDVFDEYFELIAKIFNWDLKGKIEDIFEQPENISSEEEIDSGIEPDIKEELGIDEVDENLDLPEDEGHEDNESIHGGKKDQHNDILKKEDLSKKGGGNKKDFKIGSEGEKDKDEQDEGSTPPETPSNEQSQLVEEGSLVGGGKGKSILERKIDSEDLPSKEKKADIVRIKRRVKFFDRRERYEVRPDKASIKQVIRNIRKIVLDVSEIKSSNINL